MAHVDVAKGLGIILVVIGHADPPLLVGSLIYMFHMPFFFMISGYVLRDTGVRDFAGRKSVRYLLPYASYLFLFALLAPKPDLETILNPYDRPTWAALLVGGEHLVTFATAFWFPTALFFSVWLALLVGRIRLRSLQWTVAASLLALAYVNQAHHVMAWPLAVNVAAAGSCFVLVGRELRRYSWWERIPATVWVLAAGVLVALAHAAGWRYTFDMKHAQYGVFPVSLMIAFLMTCFMLQVSRSIHRIAPWCARGLIALGGASMTIMYLHQYFQLRVGYSRFGEIDVLRVAVGVLFPLAIHHVVSRVGWLNWLLCGAGRPAPNRGGA